MILFIILFLVYILGSKYHRILCTSSSSSSSSSAGDISSGYAQFRDDDNEHQLGSLFVIDDIIVSDVYHDNTLHIETVEYSVFNDKSGETFQLIDGKNKPLYLLLLSYYDSMSANGRTILTVTFILISLTLVLAYVRKCYTRIYSDKVLLDDVLRTLNLPTMNALLTHYAPITFSTHFTSKLYEEVLFIKRTVHSRELTNYSREIIQASNCDSSSSSNSSGSSNSSNDSIVDIKDKCQLLEQMFHKIIAKILDVYCTTSRNHYIQCSCVQLEEYNDMLEAGRYIYKTYSLFKELHKMIDCEPYTNILSSSERLKITGELASARSSTSRLSNLCDVVEYALEWNLSEAECDELRQAITLLDDICNKEDLQEINILKNKFRNDVSMMHQIFRLQVDYSAQQQQQGEMGLKQLKSTDIDTILSSCSSNSVSCSSIASEFNSDVITHVDNSTLLFTSPSSKTISTIAINASSSTSPLDLLREADRERRQMESEILRLRQRHIEIHKAEREKSRKTAKLRKSTYISFERQFRESSKNDMQEVMRMIDARQTCILTAINSRKNIQKNIDFVMCAMTVTCSIAIYALTSTRGGILVDYKSTLSRQLMNLCLHFSSGHETCDNGYSSSFHISSNNAYTTMMVSAYSMSTSALSTLSLYMTKAAIYSGMTGLIHIPDYAKCMFKFAGSLALPALAARILRYMGNFVKVGLGDTLSLWLLTVSVMLYLKEPFVALYSYSYSLATLLLFHIALYNVLNVCDRSLTWKVVAVRGGDSEVHPMFSREINALMQGTRYSDFRFILYHTICPIAVCFTAAVLGCMSSYTRSRGLQLTVCSYDIYGVSLCLYNTIRSCISNVTD